MVSLVTLQFSQVRRRRQLRDELLVDHPRALAGPGVPHQEPLLLRLRRVVVRGHVVGDVLPGAGGVGRREMWE